MTKVNTNNLEVTTISSNSLANMSIDYDNRADAMAYSAYKLCLCALLQANSDVELSDNITIGSYYDNDSKKAKMNWNERVLTQVFNYTDTKEVPKRVKVMIERTLPIVTLLIKEGYELVTVKGKKQGNYNDIINNSEHKNIIIFNANTHELYLPKGIANIQSIKKGDEPVFNWHELTLMQSPFELMANEARRLLGITKPSKGNQSTYVAQESSIVDDDTALAAIVRTHEPTASSPITPTLSITSLLKATLAQIENKDITLFNEVDRRLLYQIAQHLVVQLPDDAINALLDSNNPIDFDNDDISKLDTMIKNAA